MEAFYKLQEISSNVYLFFAFLSIPVGCLGIVGNIVCVIVLSRPKMRHNSINLMLLCLAFWDIAAIIGVSGSFGSYSTLLYLFTKDIPFSDHFNSQVEFQIFSYALGETAQHASIGLTLLITLERCFHVCMPLRSREVITIKRTYIAIIILNASTVIFNLPFWLTYEDGNGTFLKTAFTNSWFFESFYSNTSELIIFHLLPFIVIICGNIAIMIALRKFNKRRRDMQAAPGIDAKEISLTKVTLTIIGLYLITNLLLVVWVACGSGSFYVKTIPGYANTVMLFVMILNSSVNFLIYCGFGESFRKQFRETFLCR